MRKAYNSDEVIVTSRISMAYGMLVMPGHDCNQEDHHFSQHERVYVLEVLDEGFALAIPEDCLFMQAIMDGTLAHDLTALRVQYDLENPEN